MSQVTLEHSYQMSTVGLKSSWYLRTSPFRETKNLVILLYENHTVVNWSSQNKKRINFLHLFYQRNFFKICGLSECIEYWISFQNIHAFTYQKALLNTRVQIKYIAIAKCNLFFHYHKKNLTLLFSQSKLGAKQKKQMLIPFILLDHVCKVNKWCLVVCFYFELGFLLK